MDLKCVFSEDESLRFLSRLVYQEEKYKMKRNVKKGEDYPHHIYNIYPPLILQNLLPFQIFVEAMVCVSLCECSVFLGGLRSMMMEVGSLMQCSQSL